MAEQKQDKSNGTGKVLIAGKKRRKGQDLQPIQTLTPQQNGFRNNYAGSTGLASVQAVEYHNRYSVWRLSLAMRAWLRLLARSV
jgi:hypothetical protein